MSASLAVSASAAPASESAIAANPRAMGMSATTAMSPNWWTCSSYDKVCLFVDVSGDPLGRQLNVYSVGVGCINLTSEFNDAITSIDNGWNDADIVFRGYKNSNCQGSTLNVNGNDAVSLHSSSAWWGYNDNFSSFKVTCEDFFGDCYYGP